MANSPELMAILQEARARARRPGGTISQEELERRRPLTAEEHAAGDALLAQWLAEDAAAGVAEPAAASEPLRKRRRARADARFNGRLLTQVPKSLRRDLTERAELEGVSLERLVLSYLSRGLGEDAPRQQPAR